MKEKFIDILYDKNTNKYSVPYNPAQDKDAEKWRRLDSTTDSSEIFKVGILDSGMMYHHPLLKDVIVDGIDFTGEGLEDQNGHGTMVTLIMVTNVKSPIYIYNIKVMDKHLRCCEDYLLNGLIWAEEHKINLLNISLGMPKKEKCTTDSCRVCRQIEKMVHQSNTIIVAAAGNDKKHVYCPACSDHVISVGALNASGDAIADYSNKADFYGIGTFFFREL